MVDRLGSLTYLKFKNARILHFYIITELAERKGRVNFHSKLQDAYRKLRKQT